MDTLQDLLARARARAESAQAPYAGAVLPAEAAQLLEQLEGAVLVDVRTQAELDWVGTIPGALHIEWQRYPGGAGNPGFAAQLAAAVPPAAAVFFLCRSGGRSHAAASLASQSGYGRSYNVLEGFEGDRDVEGHRNRLGGWRHAGLPWKQS